MAAPEKGTAKPKDWRVSSPKATKSLLAVGPDNATAGQQQATPLYGAAFSRVTPPSKHTIAVAFIGPSTLMGAESQPTYYAENEVRSPNGANALANHYHDCMGILFGSRSQSSIGSVIGHFVHRPAPKFRVGCQCRAMRALLLPPLRLAPRIKASIVAVGKTFNKVRNLGGARPFTLFGRSQKEMFS